MWTYAFLVACLSLATARASELEGRLCCEESQVVLQSGECVPGNNTTSFSPPIYGNLSEPQGNVSWQVQPMECPDGYKREFLSLNGGNNWLQIEEDMIYLWRPDVFVYKTSTDFCVGLDADDENQYMAAVCLPDIKTICKEQTCVQKCCSEGEALIFTDQMSCIRENGTELFSPDFRDLNENSVPPPKDFLVVDSLPKCKLLDFLDPNGSLEQRFFMLLNGMLYEPHSRETFGASTYCVDFFVNTETDVALVCREPLSRALQIKNQLQTVGHMISCIFLSLTIVLHLAIPSLRNTQSLCILCHMVSLLVADAVLFTSNQFTQNISTEHCVANAFILQYSFLSTFFWLNVMCFDVWRTIKATVNMVRLTEITSNEKKKFLLYSTYAWGVPLIIVVVTAVLHLLPDHLLYDNTIRPGFGTVSCWFREHYALLIYFYGFVGLLFFVNLVLLGHTVAMLMQAGVAFGCKSKNITFTAFNRTHLDVFWQRFCLFCLMALCWVTEILSWKIYPHEIWITTDIINSLQGFIVFVIFISCKKKRELIYNLWKNTKHSLTLAAKTIFRTESTGPSHDQVRLTNTDGSTRTKNTDDGAPVEKGSTQESSNIEKPSEGTGEVVTVA